MGEDFRMGVKSWRWIKVCNLYPKCESHKPWKVREASGKSSSTRSSRT